MQSVKSAKGVKRVERVAKAHLVPAAADPHLKARRVEAAHAEARRLLAEVSVGVGFEAAALCTAFLPPLGKPGRGEPRVVGAVAVGVGSVDGAVVEELGVAAAVRGPKVLVLRRQRVREVGNVAVGHPAPVVRTLLPPARCANVSRPLPLRARLLDKLAAGVVAPRQWFDERFVHIVPSVR